MKQWNNETMEQWNLELETASLKFNFKSLILQEIFL